MTGTSSHVVRAGGLNVHLLRAGSGAPLVLLPGWPEFSGIWRRNIPALAEAFDVIAPDLRKFGRTRPVDPADATPTLPATLAADLAALLDALGLDRVGLVAHDVGAFAAQAFARAHPDRLAGLFFFDCPYPGIGSRWAEPGHLKEIWYQSFNQQPWAAALIGSSREACRLYIGHFLAHWAHDPHALDGLVEEWVDNFMQPGVLQGGFDWYIGYGAERLRVMRDGAPSLPPIPHPARVLWGASDKVLKAEWSDRLGDTFSDVEVTVVPEAGHYLHYERPDLANREMLAFFRRVLGPGAGP